MPYIPQERRDALARDPHPLVAGELNFIITRFLLSCSNNSLAQSQIIQWIYAYWDKKPCYQTANDILGALECAGLELLRRNPTGRRTLSRMQILTHVKSSFYLVIVGPYEDTAIARNGDLEFYLQQKEVK